MNATSVSIKKRARVGQWLIFCLITGCTLGGNWSKLSVVNNPDGIRLNVRFRDASTINGELLSVGDNAITILVSDMAGKLKSVSVTNPKLPLIMKIDMEETWSIILKGTNLMLVRGGEVANQESVDKARLYSRYPQGISDSLMTELLAVYDQTELLNVPDKSSTK